MVPRHWKGRWRAARNIPHVGGSEKARVTARHSYFSLQTKLRLDSFTLQLSAVCGREALLLLGLGQQHVLDIGGGVRVVPVVLAQSNLLEFPGHQHMVNISQQWLYDIINTASIWKIPFFYSLSFGYRRKKNSSYWGSIRDSIRSASPFVAERTY